MSGSPGARPLLLAVSLACATSSAVSCSKVTGPPGSGGSGAISDARRTAIFADVEQKASQLGAQDPAHALQDLAACLRTLPECSDADVGTDQSV